MGQTFYFCSPNCVEQFDADPHRYAQAALAATETPLPAGSATTGFNPDLVAGAHRAAGAGAEAGRRWPRRGGRRVWRTGRAQRARERRRGRGHGRVRSTTRDHCGPGRGASAGRFPGRRRANPHRHRGSALCLLRRLHRGRPAGDAGRAQRVRQRRHAGSHHRVPAPADHPGATAQRHPGLGLPGPAGRQRGAGRQARGRARPRVPQPVPQVPLCRPHLGAGAADGLSAVHPVRARLEHGHLAPGVAGQRAADPAGAGLVGRPLLHRRVGSAQAPRSQHEHPDRARHRRRLALLHRRYPVSRVCSRRALRSRSTTWWPW